VTSNNTYADTDPLSPPKGLLGPGKIYQPYILTNIDKQEPGTNIIVKDADGNLIVSHTPNVSYGNVLITSPLIKASNKYNIVAGKYTGSAVASEADEGTPENYSVTSAKEYFSSAISLKQNMVMTVIFIISMVILF